MKELVFTEHKHVRLSAYNASSSASGRLAPLRGRRHDTRPGHDLGRRPEGLAPRGLRLVEAREGRDRAQRVLPPVAAEQAMRNGSVLYNPDYHLGACKQGPVRAPRSGCCSTTTASSPTRATPSTGSGSGSTTTATARCPSPAMDDHPGQARRLLRPPQGDQGASEWFPHAAGRERQATKKTFYWSADQPVRRSDLRACLGPAVAPTCSTLTATFAPTWSTLRVRSARTRCGSGDGSARSSTSHQAATRPTPTGSTSTSSPPQARSTCPDTSSSATRTTRCCPRDIRAQARGQTLRVKMGDGSNDLRAPNWSSTWDPTTAS